MFLLIRFLPVPLPIRIQNLHSNMFLLILGTADWTVRTFEFTFQYVSINTRDYDQRSDWADAFTFQYVSINTNDRPCIYGGKNNLHSNMFLLIRHRIRWKSPSIRNLHSNMFLLIQEPLIITITTASRFTFQYVSINTDYVELYLEGEIHLHSNMFLLILRYPTQLCHG